MNLNRTELIHILQLCHVTNIKSDDPLCRLNHTQLCDLVASSAVCFAVWHYVSLRTQRCLSITMTSALTNLCGTTQIARAYFTQQSMPGGDLNGAGRSKSEQAGWILAIDRGGRITPEKKIREISVHDAAGSRRRMDASSHPKRPKTSMLLTTRSYTPTNGTNVTNFWKQGKQASRTHAPVAMDQKTFQRAASICATPSFGVGGQLSWGRLGRLSKAHPVLAHPEPVPTHVYKANYVVEPRTQTRRDVKFEGEK